MTTREIKASSLGYVEQGTVLWDGANFMRANATLDLGVSADDIMSGVVLVWSRYEDQTVQNTYNCTTFVPKGDAVIGVSCPCSTVTSSGTVGYPFTKYVAVRWQNEPITINGYSGNAEGNGTKWALVKVIAA